LQTFGNGKRHCTPLPERPRKIKRITLEAFLGIKELLKKIKRPRVNKRQPYSKEAKLIYKIANEFRIYAAHTYKPSNIINTGDSLFFSWRRVKEWEKYINDPVENAKNVKKQGYL
jgi:hypothetical protein